MVTQRGIKPIMWQYSKHLKIYHVLIISNYFIKIKYYFQAKYSPKMYNYYIYIYNKAVMMLYINGVINSYTI